MAYEVIAATLADLEDIMRIYDEARAFMRASGNYLQWTGGYPSEDLIRDDIRLGRLYICADDCGDIGGVFVLAEGEDPTYEHIDGEWPDNRPYATLHRMGAACGRRGIADAALGFALTRHERVRADTHADNRPMRGWLESRGFKYCGVIRVSDGGPRLAYATTRRADV